MSEYKTVEELLSDPKRWTQHCYARDKAGNQVIFGEPGMACWCVLGAIGLVYPEDPQQSEAMRKIRDVVGIDVNYWNDAPERTYAEVLAAVRKAGI